MWFVAAVLIAAMATTVLAGFHTGPHTHLVGSAIGVVAATWLVVMAVEGHSLPLLIALLVAVLLVATGVGFLAWRGLRGGPPASVDSSTNPIEGSHGKALTALNPEGIVRVRGENWSATALNGAIEEGDVIQVINAKGVHLEVWGEHNLPSALSPIEARERKGSPQ